MSLRPPYTPAQLGHVIRLRRTARVPALTQEELATRAGYGSGGNVSISRIESGAARPSPERLAGIADALGTTVRTLEYEAASVHIDSGDEQPAARNGPWPLTGAESTKELGRRLQSIVDSRVAQVNERGAALDSAHDLARDRFFNTFVELAGGIANTPVPPVVDLPTVGDEEPDAAEQAAIRIKIASNSVGSMLAGVAGGGAAGAAAGGAAAYATFVGAATFGTASTGAAISTLSGVAATNAALAALGGGSLAAGGAGIAGGTALLAGIAAAPIAILGVGGLIWMARRNKRQEQELRVRLEDLARELEDGRPGFEAAVSAMSRSESLLHDIGTYAGRAVMKLGKEVEGLTDWSELDAKAKEQYEAFSTVAACQVAIVTIDFTNFMTLRDTPLQHYVELTDSILASARHDVDRLV